MLQNHAKPPGPSNRGLRSELKWDKRPIDIQIIDRVKDVQKPRPDEKELKELKDLLATHSH